jgi:hypothetical protein
MPISSREPTSIFREKLPEATRFNAVGEPFNGVVMVLASRKESSTEMIRPNTRASTMWVNRNAFSSEMVWRES